MTRRERLEARAERRRQWAESRAGKANAAHDRVHQIADQIPFGQPILVGHHSERHARADQRRMENGMRSAIDNAKMADKHEQTAGEIERQLRTSIFSDDVDAVEQLEAKAATLEAKRERIKAYNASCRKGQRDVTLLDEKEQDDLATTARVAGYQIGKNGAAPAYWLSNLGATIRTTRQRIEQVKRDQRDQETGTRRHGRVMTSRYGGTCPDCGEDFDRGDVIVWFRATREALCRSCGEA